MLGQSLFSFFTVTSPYPANPSPTASASTPNLAADLDHALRRAPFYKRAELEELCHWLVCRKNLWPDAASEIYAGKTRPFSVYERHQSLLPDPDCINRTICKVLGNTDDDLVQDIDRYVDASGEGHWQALLEQRHPASGIDPSDAPFHWPKQCLAWAVNTMEMVAADLSHTDLSGMDLSGIDFYGAILFGCNMKNTVVRECDLTHADVSYADMEGADLAGSDVKNTLFRNANLAGANLSGLTFSTDENNLEDANFDGAYLNDIGLDIGPYTVGKDGAYALRKGLLPAPLDHMLRDNLRHPIYHFLHPLSQTHGDDSDSDYLTDFTDDEAGNVEAV
ncbi:pentapeptide repeat-containing protein [Oxalobacteraceae bacterium CAVE-383]|nr:pentapeptide repeat-containing protein [Oxalobacteraceae bacterium CAVE-383]